MPPAPAEPIRAYLPHAPLLAAIHAASFAAAEAWTVATFAAQLAMPPVFGLIDGPGFVLARVAADEAEILTIAVHPDGRRHGHALRLLEAAEIEAADRGAAMMFLEVARTNAAARALYSVAGYTEAGLRRGYYSDGGDALVLRRTL